MEKIEPINRIVLDGWMENRLQCVYIDELDFGRLRITFVDFDF